MAYKISGNIIIDNNGDIRNVGVATIGLIDGKVSEKAITEQTAGSEGDVTGADEILLYDSTTNGLLRVTVDEFVGGSGIGTIVTEFEQLTVTGVTTVGFLTATSIFSSGVVTATSFDGNLIGNSTGLHNGDVYSRTGAEIVLEVPLDTGTGELKANVTGETVSVSSSVTAPNFYGTVTGNVFGDTLGDHDGDVYSRDGSQLVLEVPATSGDAHYIGTVTGDVTGDTTGTHFGTNIGQQDGDVYTADGATQVVDTGATPAPVFKGDAEGLTGTPNISVGNVSVGGTILPDTTLTYDLGSDTNRFKDIYLSGSTINLAGNTLSSPATDLLYNGDQVVTKTGEDITLTGDLTVRNIDASGIVSSTSLDVTTVSAAGSITASTLYGDGSNLSGVNATVANLNDIGDVDAASPANSNALIYNSTTLKWEPGFGPAFAIDANENVYAQELVQPAFTTGANNSLIGLLAGESLTSGSDNVIFGSNAGKSITAENDNVFLGKVSGAYSKGSCNIYIGAAAGQSIAPTNPNTGARNVAIGWRAGRELDSGNDNTMIGTLAGVNLTNGNDNTLIGQGSGNLNVTGSINTFIGKYSGRTLVSGTENTFIGTYAGEQFSAAATANTVIGSRSAATSNSAVLTGSNNVLIGNDIRILSSNASDVVIIGNGYSTTVTGPNLAIGNGANSWIRGDQNYAIILNELILSDDEGGSGGIIAKQVISNTYTGTAIDSVGAQVDEIVRVDVSGFLYNVNPNNGAEATRSFNMAFPSFAHRNIKVYLRDTDGTNGVVIDERDFYNDGLGNITIVPATPLDTAVTPVASVGANRTHDISYSVSGTTVTINALKGPGGGGGGRAGVLQVSEQRWLGPNTITLA